MKCWRLLKSFVSLVKSSGSYGGGEFGVCILLGWLMIIFLKLVSSFISFQDFSGVINIFVIVKMCCHTRSPL